MLACAVLPFAQAQTLQGPDAEETVDTLAKPAFALSIVLVLAVLLVALASGAIFLIIWMRLRRTSMTAGDHHKKTRAEIRAAKKARIKARMHELSVTEAVDDLEMESEALQTLDNLKNEESQREQELFVQARLKKKKSAHKQVKPALSTLGEDTPTVDADVVGSEHVEVEIVSANPPSAVDAEPVASGSAAADDAAAEAPTRAAGAPRPQSMTVEAMSFASGTQS